MKLYDLREGRSAVGGKMKNIWVAASLTLCYTKARAMRHHPAKVRAWINRRIPIESLMVQ